MADDTLEAARSYKDIIRSPEYRDLGLRIEQQRKQAARERFRAWQQGVVSAATMADGVPAAAAIDATQRTFRQSDPTIAARLSVAEQQAALEKQQAAERGGIREYDLERYKATLGQQDRLATALGGVIQQAMQSDASRDVAKTGAWEARQTAIQKDLDALETRKALMDPKVGARADAVAAAVQAKMDEAGNDPQQMARVLESDDFWLSLKKAVGSDATGPEVLAALDAADSILPKGPDGQRFFGSYFATRTMNGAQVQPRSQFANQLDPQFDPETALHAMWEGGKAAYIADASKAAGLETQMAELGTEIANTGGLGASQAGKTLLELLGVRPAEGYGGADGATGAGGAQELPGGAPPDSDAAASLLEINARLQDPATAAQMKAEILADPDFQAAMRAAGLDPANTSPDVAFDFFSRAVKAWEGDRKQQTRRVLRGKEAGAPIPTALSLPEQPAAPAAATPPAPVPAIPSMPAEEEEPALAAEDAAKRQADEDEATLRAANEQGATNTAAILSQIEKQRRGSFRSRRLR